MGSIRILQFAGIVPDRSGHLLDKVNAQIAHNCVLSDGSLRPAAKWLTLRTLDQMSDRTRRALFSLGGERDVIINPGRRGVMTEGMPFPKEQAVTVPFADIYAPGRAIISIPDAQYYSQLITRPPNISGSVSYTRAYDSIKPVNRIYAVSCVSNVGGVDMETPLAIINAQEPTAILYEGDLVNVNVNVGYTDGPDYYKARVYRSMTGLDTGQAVANSLDTEWHLVFEKNVTYSNRSVQYIDGASATAVPLDVHNDRYSFSTYMEDMLMIRLTEGGHYVFIGDHNVHISEPFKPWACPPEGRLHIPEAKIVGAAVHGDTIYLGTNKGACVVAVSMAEAGIQTNLRWYKEANPCLPFTMDASAAGAIYASPQGVVSISRDGMQMLSRDIGSPGDAFVTKQINDDTSGFYYNLIEDKVGYEHTSYGAYYQGKYYGFCMYAPPFLYGSGMEDQSFLDDIQQVPNYDDSRGMYILDVGSGSSNAAPYSQLVTQDGPMFDVAWPEVPSYLNIIDHCIGDQGLYVLLQSDFDTTPGYAEVKFQPAPGNQSKIPYAKAPKMPYTWRSKKFIMDGRTVMTAMKVVHKGCLCVNVYVDGCCAFSRNVTDCGVFRLPPQVTGTTWEIELIGTAHVTEVHMASSVEELLQNE